MTEGSKSLEQKANLNFTKGQCLLETKRWDTTKLQSSRWNKRPLRVPFSTAPQWRSVEPSKVNLSTRLLPSGRGKNIHFYKKHRRVDPIHFTMSSSTKTTQPRDPAKSSHFRRKMAQHKRDQPKQAGAASTTTESYSLSTRELKKRARHFVHGQRQAQHRPEESQTGSPKLCRWQAQAGPAKDHLPNFDFYARSYCISFCFEVYNMFFC